MTSRKRLTTHQAEVFRRIARRCEVSPRSIALAEHIRCPGACSHLVEKGYIERQVIGHGPRGGERIAYSLTEAGAAHFAKMEEAK